jgi:hypothetical protein
MIPRYSFFEKIMKKCRIRNFIFHIFQTRILHFNGEYAYRYMKNKHSESIAKAIQVPNQSHQIQTCNQYQYTSLQIERIILKGA